MRRVGNENGASVSLRSVSEVSEVSPDGTLSEP